MLINRFMFVNITATIDLNSIKPKLLSIFPNVTITKNNLNDKIPGIILQEIIIGYLIGLKEIDEVQFKVDCFMFGNGCFIFKITFDSPKIFEELKGNSLFNDKIDLLIDGKKRTDPLFIQFQLFIAEIFNFETINSIIAQVDRLDQDSSDKMQKLIKDETRLDAKFIGSQIDIDLVLNSNHVIIVDQFDEIGSDIGNYEKVSSKEYEVYKQDETYYCNNCLDDFIKDYIKKEYRRNMMSIYSKQAFKWIDVIQKEAKNQKMNLDEKNKVFWENIKKNHEIWDLNFLDLYAEVYKNIYNADNLKFVTMLNDNSNIWEAEYETAKRNNEKNLENVKYLLANLSTPSKAHDEMILQKTTDKGNDLILLLSFFALSIPLVGEFFYAEGIPISAKLNSGLIILSLPVIYFLYYNLRNRKNVNKNMKKYLLRKLKDAEKDILETQSKIDVINSDTTLEAKSKQSALSLYTTGLESTQKYIDQLKGKLKLKKR